LPAGLEPEVRAHLLHLYGSRAADVLAPARDDPSLLERLHPAGPDIAAQALYAATHEWAHDAGDVLRRRTTVALRGLAGDDVQKRVEELLAATRA
jgi:glycerol-3-phosphate dehydrogenase